MSSATLLPARMTWWQFEHRAPNFADITFGTSFSTPRGRDVSTELRKTARVERTALVKRDATQVARWMQIAKKS